MSENKKLKARLREVTDKLKLMDERGLASMNRTAGTILAYQEMLEAEQVELEHAAG